MAYKEVVTTGPIEWAKIFEENRDMVGFEGQDAFEEELRISELP